MGPRVRRLFKYVRRFIATVVVLGVLAVGFVHTRWGKTLVRGRVEAKLAAAFDGRASLGALDYGFLFSSLELGDLVIRDRQGRVAIAIAAVHADLDRGSILHGAPVIDRLDVTGLTVAMVEDATGRSNLVDLAAPSTTGGREPLASLQIRALAVHGDVTLARADGTTLAVRELAVTGTVTARPAAHEVDVTLGPIAANVHVARPNTPARDLALAIAGATLARRGDALDAEVHGLALGAVAIASVTAHRTATTQAIEVAKLRIDHTKLQTLLGRKVLVDDVTVDATLTGPIEALVVHGAVATRSTTLTLDGTVDLADRLRPHYQLVLAGTGKSEDLLITPNPRMPAIATDLRITAAGAGFTLADLDAAITVDVGATTVGTIAVAGLTAKLVAAHGAVHLETFTAKGLGFELGATGRVGADAVVHGRLTVAGDPAETLRVLHAAGIAVPRRLPPLGKLALAVTADGVLDGALVVALEPTRLALARGSLDVGGTARLANKVVVDASTTIALHGLELGALAQLAGRPPRIAGSVSGTVTLTRSPTAQHADYDVAIALRDPSLTLLAQGRADATHATATARIVHAGIALGHVTAELPLDARGLARTRAWHVVVDAPTRSLAALLALVPPPLRAKLPPDLVGDVTLHADVRGTPSRPRGTLDARVTGPRHGDLHATLTPTDDGRVVVATTGTLGMVGGGGGALDATLAGTVTVGGPALVVDETLAIAERPLADVPRLPPKLAALGGTVGGRVHVTGTPPKLALDASFAWRGYRTASGTADTTLALTGSPTHLVATIAVTPRAPTTDHAGATIVADVTRGADRLDVVARVHADDQPLLPLLPALLPTIPPEGEVGRLRWDMTADLGVALGPTGPTLDRADVTGSLALRGGAFALPHTARRWHGIDLEVAGAPEGVRLVTLDLHERDREVADRRLHASGLLTIDHLRPTRLALALTARDWLLLGTTPAGLADAPTGALDATLRIDADLTTPVIGVDATVDQLTLRAPDRHDRAHQPERASIAGDVIFVDATTRVGALPAPLLPAPRRPPPRLPPIDLRVHLPTPVHVVKAPLDIMARGELVVTVRPEGIVTRGVVEMPSGSISLFGYDHPLVDGRMTFDEHHPGGRLDLHFERPLPDAALRDRADPRAGARISVTGDPAKPTVVFSGAANATLPEVFALYNAGRSVYAPRPGVPASTMAQTPRGDQINILAYVSLALPHLLFLDRASAWSDANEPRGAYGRIRNLELERATSDEATRVRAVGRPTTPGRSTGEVQLDHLFVHDARAAFGIGLRVGDRLGGGLGLFFDWTSAR